MDTTLQQDLSQMQTEVNKLKEMKLGATNIIQEVEEYIKNKNDLKEIEESIQNS